MRIRIAQGLRWLARRLDPPVYEHHVVGFIDGKYTCLPSAKYYAAACMDDAEVIEAVQHLWEENG